MPVHVFHPALPRASCRLPDPTRLLSARYPTRLVGRGYADNMANAFDPVSELSALLTEVSQLKTNARAAINPSPPGRRPCFSRGREGATLYPPGRLRDPL